MGSALWYGCNGGAAGKYEKKKKGVFLYDGVYVRLSNFFSTKYRILVGKSPWLTCVVVLFTQFGKEPIE